MEEENVLNLDTNSINTPVVVSLITLYILSRSMTSTTPTINLIKGKFRSITGIILKGSIFSMLIYSIVLYYLSTKFTINKLSLELFHQFDEHYIVTYNQYSIDLGLVLISSLKIAEALFISSVFLCISIAASSYKDGTSVENTIITITRLWGTLRPFVAFYAEKINFVINEKMLFFVKLLFCNIEFGIAAFLAILIKFRANRDVTSSIDIGFFSFSILLYGFLKYCVNLIDFPFKINNSILNIIYSLQYGLLMSSYLLMASIVFPRRKRLNKAAEKEEVIHTPQSSVAVLEDVIEFDESKLLALVN